MKFTQTPLDGNFIIDLEPHSDERGFFARYFCSDEFAAQGLNTVWVQINNSFSKTSGTMRGLHYQSQPHSEVKLVRCVAGAIWDVVVDMRQGSQTLGQWFGKTLSVENRSMMYVPKGFAHGFVTLEPNTEIIYLVSEFYSPESECTLLWNDPELAIQWPFAPTVISDKDRNASFYRDIIKTS